MELIFRQRLDRPDAKGQATVFADLHWAGGHRWKVPTGVKCLPAHWQPTKAKRIATGADNSTQANLRLNRLAAAIGGVFLAAEAAGRPEAAVAPDELRAALATAGAGSGRMAPAAPVAVDPHAPLPDTTPWAVLHERWQQESRDRVSASALKGFGLVLAQLTAFDPALRIGTLSKERLAAYTAWLYARGYKDATLTRHYWFLRECCQLTGRPVPKWMTLANARYGRALSLQREEVVALATVPLPPTLARERDVFLFQLLLLLRDSDLRALQPHHVRPAELPGWGLRLCVDLFQEKTGEPVRVPLPPLAAAIWQHYGGQLPVHSNWTRNEAIRRVGEAAGLTREHLSVAFSGKVKHEALAPVWRALHTHTARHTGATLLVWASDGDQALKELALGHAAVYGHDTLERYGPRILAAWAKVFADHRGLFPEDRGQLPEMPPVLAHIGAGGRRFPPGKNSVIP